MLNIQDVHKTFWVKSSLFKKKPVHALKGVSLKVERGEIFAIVGESGSGKSTLGKIVLRLERPDKGKVLLEDRDVFSMGKEYTKLVSAVFQDPTTSLNPRYTVYQIVEEPLLVHGQKDIPNRVKRSLELSQVPLEYLERRPTQLSGGQRQRVAISRAIVLEPRLIVADEPTASLDASIRREILNLFLKLKERNISTLLITHDVRAVEYTADRVGVLYRGVLVEVGSKSQVLKNPLHPYTQYLLENVPVKHPRERRPRSFLEPMLDETSSCPFYSLCPKRLEECRYTLREVSIDGRLVKCNLY
ncbi:ABC transporter ATP-binding protein [Thermocrinis minervae]|uniref:Peptide/nickel transport system ATP-binding protein n=1 Tax=Thermocrinis minervae TaxID=381751 RepID=A0A1M6SCH0_9AQUI|nr:ABC transporter ATP-binding protein [Thermocrinis minervae]SHK42237.1 peptide/nickel transport system ATP-binding protein [Thermocrinis minervae]